MQYLLFNDSSRKQWKVINHMICVYTNIFRERFSLYAIWLYLFSYCFLYTLICDKYNKCQSLITFFLNEQSLIVMKIILIDFTFSFTIHVMLMYRVSYCEKPVLSPLSCYDESYMSRVTFFSHRIAFSCGNYVDRTIWHSKLINFGERIHFIPR